MKVFISISANIMHIMDIILNDYFRYYNAGKTTDLIAASCVMAYKLKTI